MRRVPASLVVTLALALGACSAGESDAEPATPGGNVDPTSDNVITDPINRARSTADDAEDHYEQYEEYDRAP